MPHRSLLAKSATGLLGTLLALGPNVSPAQAMPSGDRAQRCATTLQKAQGLQLVISEFRTRQRSEYAFLNMWVQPNGQKLRRILAASENQAILTRVLNLADDITRNRNTAGIPRIEERIQRLVENLRERREFTQEFKGANGEVVTKQVAY